MPRQTLPVKAGDKIDYPVTVKDEGALVDLSGTVWLVQVRDRHDTLIAEGSFTPDPDQVTNKGQAILSFTSAESANFRTGHLLDVEETVTEFTWLSFELDAEVDAAHA